MLDVTDLQELGKGCPLRRVKAAAVRLLPGLVPGDEALVRADLPAAPPVEDTVPFLVQAHDAVGAFSQQPGEEFVGAEGPVG